MNYKVVDKEFYCRYCRSYDQCKGKHRSGIWFKLAFGNTLTDRCLIITIGEGEREFNFPFNCSVGEEIRRGMSGCIYFQKGHITMSGWHYLTDIITERTDKNFSELQSITLTQSEQIILSKLLNQNKVKILKALTDEKIISLEDDWGLWNHIKPLFFVYKRRNVKEFPLGARIEEQPDTFKAKFVWGDIQFFIPKGRYTHHYLFDNLNVITIGKRELWQEGKQIFYGEVYGRKIVYYYHYDHNIIYANEVYNNHIHPPALINPPLFEYLHSYIQKLFYRRLGDILFIKEEEIEEPAYCNEKIIGAILKPYRIPIIPAQHQHLSKVKIIQGELEETPNLKIKSSSEVVIYHPEHGLILLEGGEYYIFQVPYISRGHD